MKQKCNSTCHTFIGHILFMSRLENKNKGGSLPSCSLQPSLHNCLSCTSEVCRRTTSALNWAKLKDIKLAVLCIPTIPSYKNSGAQSGPVLFSGDSWPCLKTMLVDITGRGETSSIWWVKAKDASQHLAVHRTNPTANPDVAPYVKSAKAEQPCTRVNGFAHFQQLIRLGHCFLCSLTHYGDDGHWDKRSKWRECMRNSTIPLATSVESYPSCN